jgi:transglutaminase-like putative cysteine protease
MDVRYSIRHVTRFAYSAAISESVMEVRMQPRSDERQRCLRFELTTQPRARVFAYRDSLGNTVHHFDIPNRHARLIITADAAVELPAAPRVTYESLPEISWAEIDAMAATGAWWEGLAFSRFARETPRLVDLRREIGITRAQDPVTVIRTIATELHQKFEYAPASTSVDSPIDEALQSRSGVCQDFAHIMISLVRSMGIPSRYVSGYLAADDQSDDRARPGATHAWVEVCLPEVGWVGIDPTNNALAGGRHIRVAVGRDYGDVPPTRGIYRGEAESELGVTVEVSAADGPLALETVSSAIVWVGSDSTSETAEAVDMQQQQQQQQ